MVSLKLLSILIFLSTSIYADVKFGSYNIRTFDKNSSSTNKIELRKIIENADFDFFGVQEIVNADSFKKFIQENFNEYSVILSTCGGAGKQKLGFVYNHRKFKLLKITEDDSLSDVKNERCDSLRPAMVGDFQIKSSKKKFTAIVVHLKAGSGSRNYARRNTQYGILSDMVERFKKSGKKNIILMGDFNTTGYDHMDDDYKNFRSFINAGNLNTSARYIQCTSYWGGADYNDNIEESSTLDHIIYTDNFLDHSKLSFEVRAHCQKAKCRDTYETSLGVSYQEVSDHCPIELSVHE